MFIYGIFPASSMTVEHLAKILREKETRGQGLGSLNF